MVAGVRRSFDPRLFDLKTLLFGWVLAELVALAIVIKLAGFGGAVLLSIASSLAGVMMLRRLGLGAARQLRTTLSGGAPDGALLDGMLAALGALLLILPGFASDIAGLALAAPSARQFIATRLGGLTRPGGARPPQAAKPGVIDLSPAEWRVVERSEPR